MPFNHNLEKTAAGLTFGAYLEAVKLRRKQLDGRDTYGKWTPSIREHWNKGSTVSHCANFVSTMAKDSER